MSLQPDWSTFMMQQGIPNVQNNALCWTKPAQCMHVHMIVFLLSENVPGAQHLEFFHFMLVWMLEFTHPNGYTRV